MFAPNAPRCGRSCALAGTLATAMGLLSPSLAHAHFILRAPASWANQDDSGSPQKSAPCGQADPVPPYPPLVPTGAVTTFRPGQMITVTIDEKIPHPGHYRIALANSQNALPADPPVTQVGVDPCGSTTIQNPAVFPILADGVFTHTNAFTAEQSVQVKLPDGMTCTRCTLQVIEYMSNHGLNNPGGCFYHHCATITIQDTDGGTTRDDMGPIFDDFAAPAHDAATTPMPPMGGCSCHVPTGGASGAADLAGLFALGVLARGLRRRPSRRP